MLQVICYQAFLISKKQQIRILCKFNYSNSHSSSGWVAGPTLDSKLFYLFIYERLHSFIEENYR